MTIKFITLKVLCMLAAFSCVDAASSNKYLTKERSFNNQKIEACGCNQTENRYVTRRR